MKSILIANNIIHLHKTEPILLCLLYSDHWLFSFCCTQGIILLAEVLSWHFWHHAYVWMLEILVTTERTIWQVTCIFSVHLLSCPLPTNILSLLTTTQTYWLLVLLRAWTHWRGKVILLGLEILLNYHLLKQIEWCLEWHWQFTSLCNYRCT